jgi:NADPH2:quinone reductase
MKAVQYDRHGDPSVLRVMDVDEPAPAPDEVLIDVELAGVNFADINARRGTYAARGAQPAAGLGLEVLGRITARGDEVVDLRVGDRVTGFARSPGYAEMACARAALVWRVPDGVGAEQAAALPVVGLTAALALERVGRLQPADHVLITAAAGGVGTTAIQLARVLGAEMIVAAAGTASRAATASDLGAHVTIDYSSGLRTAIERQGLPPVDLVLDGVGGAVRADCLECLAPFGRLVQYGNASGAPEPLPDGRALRERSVSIGGLHLAQLRRSRPDLLDGSARRLLRWVAEDELRVPVAAVLPLEDAAEAHQRIEDRAVVGKLLLCPHA